VSADDLRILYDSEKLKREFFEKNSEDLLARLTKSEVDFHNFKQESQKEAARLGKLIESTQAEKERAAKDLENLAGKFEAMSKAAYGSYLIAWTEAKAGKVTIPKDKANITELAAYALAGFDVNRGHLSTRKEFETQLTTKLGL
jgi:hypothetical protein